MKRLIPIDPYSNFKVNSKKSHINVIVGKPTLLNLNSFENLASILQSFRKRAKFDLYAGVK